MFDFFKKWKRRYEDNEAFSRLKDTYEFDFNKKMYVVAYIVAHTDIIDSYGSVEFTLTHTYILKENGLKMRTVETITSSRDKYYKKMALDHKMYVSWVAPWKHGVDFPHIPSANEVKNGLRQPYNNYR